MATSITQAALDAAQMYLEQGNVSGAWQALADAGDRYAQNAANITNPNVDNFAQNLVQSTWEATVGLDSFNQNFDVVAQSHVQNYIRLIEQNNLTLLTPQKLNLHMHQH